MASLLRFAARQSCRILANNTPKQQRMVQPSVFLSTSKKNKDSATISEPIQSKSDSTERLEDRDENWISFGYDWVDKETDRWAHNMTMFLGFTLTIVWGGFVLAYMPDHKLRDWCYREGYLELERREREGLPLIDPNLIDPAKIELPSDEELGDTEIII